MLVAVSKLSDKLKWCVFVSQWYSRKGRVCKCRKPEGLAFGQPEIMCVHLAVVFPQGEIMHMQGPNAMLDLNTNELYICMKLIDRRNKATFNVARQILTPYSVITSIILVIVSMEQTALGSCHSVIGLGLSFHRDEESTV